MREGSVHTTVSGSACVCEMVGKCCGSMVVCILEDIYVDRHVCVREVWNTRVNVLTRVCLPLSLWVCTYADTHTLGDEVWICTQT